ncbi:MAG: transglycosylase SLT domain-containing protein [Sulfitobacter sp.]
MKLVVLGMALTFLSALVAAQTTTVVRPPEKIALSAQPKIDMVPQSRPLQEAFETDLRPPVRRPHLPRTRWQHMQGHQMWTRAALSALKSHGQPLVDLVPADIDTWCPAYRRASDQDRRAFWVGFMSALAKYESTYKPWAVGGGGKWYGLLQILPGTARGYDCNVGTGEALKNGAANLSCAVRIMAHTVPRDGVIHGYKGGRGRGVTADWGPMHSKAKRGDMAGWLRRQNYCKPVNVTRPQSRP